MSIIIHYYLSVDVEGLNEENSYGLKEILKWIKLTFSYKLYTLLKISVNALLQDVYDN